MINDSVFSVSDRIEKFVEEMMNSECEVLGSTENYETAHHLGSFCIAFAGNIIRHRAFVHYWKRYKNSDIRPKVIKNGEMGLSKVLKKCVTAHSEFRSLYGSSEFLRRLQENDKMIDDSIRRSRQSTITSWKRFSAQKIIEELRKYYLIRGSEIPEDVSLRLNEEKLSERFVVNDLAGIIELAKAEIRQGDEIDPDLIRRVVISHLTHIFMVGSQIHQNASTLIKMGLPIVKIDGLYRGMFTVQDIQSITDQLPREDSIDLQALLLERPFGGDIYIGWRYSAFMRGLI